MTGVVRAARSEAAVMNRYGVTVVDPPDIEVTIERAGPSWVARISPLGAQIVFREIRLDRDPAAEIAVSLRSRHLFRTTSTLSLTGRDRIAKTARDLAGTGDDLIWRRGIFTAVEKVLEAEGRIETVDLRTTGADSRRPLWIAGHFLVDGPSLIVMPGESGKSTIGRALALSHASGREIVPGIPPRTKGPALIVAGEAPQAASHWRSLEAISRGAGISLASIDHRIELYAPRGKPLHRIARELAEMAKDYALVILDSLQTMLSVSEHSTNIRDRDTVFWNAIDQIDRPTLIIAHPNRSDAKAWNRSDGRAAGSDVTRDRSRISWQGFYRDEQAMAGQSYRRYTLRNTKYNDGPRPAAIGLGVDWRHGVDDNDPGTVYFVEREPEVRGSRAQQPAEEPDEGEGGHPEDEQLSPLMQATLEAYRAGSTTPSALMKKFRISRFAADKRLVRVRSYLGEPAQTTLDDDS